MPHQDRHGLDGIDAGIEKVLPVAAAQLPRIGIEAEVLQAVAKDPPDGVAAHVRARRVCCRREERRRIRLRIVQLEIPADDPDELRSDRDHAGTAVGGFALDVEDRQDPLGGIEVADLDEAELLGPEAAAQEEREHSVGADQTAIIRFGDLCHPPDDAAVLVHGEAREHGVLACGTQRRVLPETGANRGVLAEVEQQTERGDLMTELGLREPQGTAPGEMIADIIGRHRPGRRRRDPAGREVRTEIPGDA
ncbi:MAG: hypothetical protein Q4Q62_06035 [Thermoplasmata archaeon]|nr:hypothetical protein [Thermoplasmata archaeon]